ncbi:MAG: outer membrane protein assembly factor BamB family protein, partial [Planctomycetota bacterium]
MEEDRLFVTLGYDAPVSVLDAVTGKILATYEETAGVEEIRCVDGILILRKGGNLVVAVDVETGRKLWEVTGRIQQFSLAAQNGRVFYQDGAAVLCLRVSDGEEFWRAQGKSPASLLVIHDGRVLLLRKQQIEALSADTGKSIWAVNSRVGRNELFVANKQL